MAERQELESHANSTSVGSRLRAAREAAGLSRTDVAEITKIPERHLISIEAGNFGALSGRTYALGFSRTYARAVGLDEREIAQAVREEMDAEANEEDRRVAAGFEPGDPSRIPSRGTAWLAALIALIVLAAGFAYWRSFYFPAVELPSLAAEDKRAPAAPRLAKPAAPPTTTPASPSAPVAATQGPVVVTALADRVWVKFTDATGKQLMQKEMASGESYTVPVDAAAPQLRTARPEALRISVGGKELPPLSERGVVSLDVSAQALLSRANGGSAAPPKRGEGASRPIASPVAAPIASPVVSPTASPAPGEPSTVSD